MDTTRFDRLTRQVAGQSDRRSMVKAALAGTLAMVGAGALGRRASANDGFEGAVCSSSADCKTGLVCEGSSTGILGGALAGVPYGPPGVDLPLISGSTGHCRYRSGDSCAKVNQACNRTSDCCNGLGLSCHNKKCKR